MEPKDQKTILFIAIIAMVGIALGFVLKDDGSGYVDDDHVESNPSDGYATYNFSYEDQLIIDKTGYGSMIPEDNMIFCVVSYTIQNNSNTNIKYYGSDIGLVVDGLVYGKEYSVLYDDGGWNIAPGVEHSGVYVFEIPEMHGDVTLKLGENELTRDKSLAVPDIPIRSAGQIYGKITYMLTNRADSIRATIFLENISYEDVISTNSYNFRLTDGHTRINHSWDTYKDPLYSNIQKIPAGQKSSTFAVVFDKPVGWNDMSKIELIWDGFPERGMEIIRI